MNFRIAPARPQDAPIILDLVTQLAGYEKLFGMQEEGSAPFLLDLLPAWDTQLCP